MIRSLIVYLVILGLLSSLTLIGVSIVKKTNSCDVVIGYIDDFCYPRSVQFFDSRGGSVLNGMKIAEHTKTVFAVGQCDSMCAFILMVSPDRVMCEDGRLGIHQANTRRGTMAVLRWISEDSRIDYNYVMDKVIATPFDGMHYISSERALKLRLVDEVIDCKSALNLD